MGAHSRRRRWQSESRVEAERQRALRELERRRGGELPDWQQLAAGWEGDPNVTVPDEDDDGTLFTRILYAGPPEGVLRDGEEGEELPLPEPPPVRRAWVGWTAAALALAFMLWLAGRLYAAPQDGPDRVEPEPAASTGSLETHGETPRAVAPTQKPGPTVTITVTPAPRTLLTPGPTVTVRTPGPTVTVGTPGPVKTVPGPTVTVTWTPEWAAP